MEWVFECSVCGETSGVELRSRVPIQPTEGENMMSVTLRSPDVELLTKITPQHLRDYHEFGLDVEEVLKHELEKLTVVCFLRSKKKKPQETEPNYAVRYTAMMVLRPKRLVKDDGPSEKQKASAEDDGPSEKQKAGAEDDGPGEKQFFIPTTSRILKEIEDEHIVGELSQTSPSAKQSIDFVSASESFDKIHEATQHSQNEPAPAEQVTDSEQVVQSPLKKNRDKLKRS